MWKRRSLRGAGYFGALLLACAVQFLLPGGSLAAAQPEGLLVKTEHILDPQMNNAPAMTVAVPEGWKMGRGQVMWNFNMISDPAHISFEVRGPADDVCFGMHSEIRFTFGPYASPDHGLIIKQPVDAESFIKEILNSDKEISDVRVKKVTKPQPWSASLAKAAADLQKLNIEERLRRGMRNPRSVQVTSDCAVVEYTCLKNGLRYEGSVIIGTMYTQAPEGVSWNTTPVISVYAHEGKLETYVKDISVILGNSFPNPAWQEVVGQITNTLQQRKISEQQRQIMANDANLRRQMQETHDHISKTRREVFNRQQEARSNVNRGWTDVITGTDRWRGSDGTTHSAPTGYGYAWSGPDGKTFYTNDSTFNPNHSSNFSGDWSQMRSVP